MYDVFFCEAFAEEAVALRQLLPDKLDGGYTDLTIQESGHSSPPSRLISTRNQSRVPRAWAPLLDGVLTRSTGYDHESELAVAMRTGRSSDDSEVRAGLELANMDNAICTPHNAFNSEEAVQRKSEHSVRQIVAFLASGQFEWQVPTGG